MTLSLPYSQWMALTLSDLNATILPVSVDHADAIIRLPCRSIIAILSTDCWWRNR
jgi:hypothetical protein